MSGASTLIFELLIQKFLGSYHLNHEFMIIVASQGL